MDRSIFLSKRKPKGSNTAVIIAEIKAGIADGTLPPGHLVASGREIGAALGCSGAPGERAKRELAKEGILVKRGNDYFVQGETTPPAQAVPDLLDAVAEAVPKPGTSGGSLVDQLNSLIDD